MAKAYSYIRFSTPKQALGDSLRRQVDRAAAYCLKHGLALDESLRDEGLSGYKGDHRKKGALGRLLLRVKRGEIPIGSVLIVEAFDRLSRQSPREALQQFLDIINAGIAIVTLVDEQLFDKASVDANVGQLFLSIGMMMGAHAGSEHKSARVKASWTTRRLRVTKVTPGWIRPNADRTDYEIIPEQQATIVRIFTECAAGKGAHRIAVDLNRDGVPTLSTRKSRGGWHDPTVRKLITERAVLGEIKTREYRDNGRRVTGKITDRYPAAIDEKLWRAANDALASRRGTGGQYVAKNLNLFSGITVCGACGAKMRMRTARASYLQCRDARRGLCDNRRWYAYAPLERIIVQSFAAIAYQIEDDTAERTALANEIAIAKRQADELEMTYGNLFAALGKNQGPLAVKNLTRLEAEHVAKLAEVETLTRRLRQLGTATRDEQIARVEKMIASLHGLTGDARDALRAKLNADLKRIMHTIVFKSDGGIAIHLFGPITKNGHVITFCKADDDAIPLVTAQDVMSALEAGHAVGVAVA